MKTQIFFLQLAKTFPVWFHEGYLTLEGVNYSQEVEVKSGWNTALQPHGWMNEWLEVVHLAFPAAGPVGWAGPTWPFIFSSWPRQHTYQLSCRLCRATDLTLSSCEGSGPTETQRALPSWSIQGLALQLDSCKAKGTLSLPPHPECQQCTLTPPELQSYLGGTVH